ncbi:hypothetical protein BsIDN1_00060 [Bacillus safensis]|uniref:DNA replication and repair protein RecF n=1 Tax=Bacillus safensis TaxID=561879 RepID=A0A5S9M171_BACIA|nr:hypothetical protein BsIDN1_00060 [Bacillus safensis]
MFAPEDLSLVKGSPQIRRRFLDMEIGQVSAVYLHDLSLYQKILSQRNHYLKQLQTRKQSDQAMLEILTEQLIDAAAKVVKRRLTFTKQLEKWAQPLHFGISRELETLTLQYQTAIEVSEASDLSKIKNSYEESFQKLKRERNRPRGDTVGTSQRDDLLFFVNGRDVQTYGSQGQQRTTALSLKLAEIDLIHEEIGEYPILLLDDVLSELDDYRQSHLLHTIQGRVQTFVTTTSVEGIDHATLKEAEIFRVASGKVID